MWDLDYLLRYSSAQLRLVLISLETNMQMASELRFQSVAEQSPSSKYFGKESKTKYFHQLAVFYLHFVSHHANVLQ